MKLELYVSQLLYRYQCVIIPGFGAFLTEIKSARLVEHANTFYPPYKSISFNTHLVNNDGLLTNAVSIFEKTTFEQATKIIENSVSEWQKELEKNKKMSFEDIGTFYKNNEGNLIFEPYLYINHLTDSFGLTPFVSPKVKRQNITPVIESIKVYDPIVLKKEVPVVVIVPKLSEIIPKIPSLKPKKYSYLKYAAVIAFGIGLTTTYVKIRNKNIVYETALIQKAALKKVDERIQQATFTLNIPQEPLPLMVKVSKAPYHVVASAFKDLDKATTEVEILQIAGFESRILPVNEFGLHTVIYASFSNEAEANDFLQRIKKFYNPQAWLLTKNLETDL